MSTPSIVELRVGAVLADYRIEEIVARGGMGVVYKARQLSNSRLVALKVVLPELSGDSTFRERFERESRIATSLEHPHVVPVYATGEADRVLYMAMRFINGVDLRHLINDGGRLAPERAINLVEQVASGLDAAHRLGLVHRDVKPANVMVESLGDHDHCYVMDFGLAKQSGSTGFTRTGNWVGTLDYVAPEQILGGDVDARTDVYALGALFYHTLTGKPPFPAGHDAAKLHAHLNSEPPKASTLYPEIPGDLDEVVARALAKDPAERFPSAGDLGRAARAALTGDAPRARERSVATGEAAVGAGLAHSAGSVLGDRSAGGVTRFDETVAEGAATPRGTGGRRRWRLAVATGAGLLALAAAAVVVVSSSGSKPQAALLRATARGGAGARPTAQQSIVRIPVARQLSNPIFGAGALWLVDVHNNVFRLDPATNTLSPPIPLGGQYDLNTAFGAGPGGVLFDPSVVRLDPQSLSVSGGPFMKGDCGPNVDLYGGPAGVWYLNAATSPINPGDAGTDCNLIEEISPATGQITHQTTATKVGGIGGCLAVGNDGSVWVFGVRNSQPMEMFRFDMGTNSLVPESSVPGGVRGGCGADAPVVADGTIVFATNSGQKDVLAMASEATGQFRPSLTPLSAGLGAGALAAGAGRAWILVGGTGDAPGYVQAYSLTTGLQSGTPIPVGHRTSGIAFGAGSVWVIAANELTRITPGNVLPPPPANQSSIKVTGPRPLTDKFAVDPRGAVGPLLLSHAGQPDVVRLEGPPQVQADSATSGGARYHSLGYGCTSQSIDSCETAFDISQASNLLVAFVTTDRRYHTVKGTHVGMAESTADRLEGRQLVGQCGGSFLEIIETSPTATLELINSGGHSVTLPPNAEGQSAVTGAGGTVGSLTLEATQGGFYLQSC